MDNREGKTVENTSGTQYIIHYFKSDAVYMREVGHVGGITIARERDLGSKLQYIDYTPAPKESLFDF